MTILHLLGADLMAQTPGSRRLCHAMLQVALVGRLQETGLGGADVAGLLALRAEAAAAAEVC